MTQPGKHLEKVRMRASLSRSYVSVVPFLLASALLSLWVLPSLYGYAPPIYDCNYTQSADSQPCLEQDSQCGGCKNSGAPGQPTDYKNGRCQVGPVRMYYAFEINECFVQAGQPLTGVCKLAAIGTCWMDWALCGETPERLLAKCHPLPAGAINNEWFCKADPSNASCRECDAGGAPGAWVNERSYECF
jgi:hypothetical protein